MAQAQQGAEEQKHAPQDEQPRLADVGVELEQRKDNDETDQPPRVAYQEPHGAADHAEGPSKELPEKQWKEGRAVADHRSVVPDGDMEAVSGRIATVQAEAGDVPDDGACADPPTHVDARRLKRNVGAAGGGERVDAAAVRRRASAAPGGYGNR